MGGHEHPSTGPSVDLITEINGDWQDKQETAGVTDFNLGGTTVYISPGLRISDGDWSGFVSAGIPVANHLNGIQSEPEWRILVGASVRVN